MIFHSYLFSRQKVLDALQVKNKVQQIAGTTALTNTLFFAPVTIELAAVTLGLWVCSHFEGVLAIRVNARNWHTSIFNLR